MATPPVVTTVSNLFAGDSAVKFFASFLGGVVVTVRSLIIMYEILSLRSRMTFKNRFVRCRNKQFAKHAAFPTGIY